MKSMKKLLAIALVLVMLTGLAVTASAADASIKITHDKSYETNVDPSSTPREYLAYKVFDASYKELTGENTETDFDDFTYTPTDAAVSYTMAADSPWATVIKDTTNQIWLNVAEAADGSYVITPKDSFTDAAAALEFANYLAANIPDDASSTTVTVDADAVSVDPGYYLIVAADNKDGSTRVALVTTDVEMYEKNTYMGTHKTTAQTSYKVGDEIEYTATVDIPADAALTQGTEGNYTAGHGPIVLWDKMDSRITFAEAISEAKMDGADFTGYSLELSPTDTSRTFEIVIPVTQAIRGKTITFKYIGVVNESAVEADTGFVNELGGDLNGYTTKPEKPVVYTFDFDVLKVFDDEDDDELTATFEIRTDPENPDTAIAFTSAGASGGYVVALPTTVGAPTQFELTNGEAVKFTGLKANDEDIEAYYLVEISTSTGYNLLDAPIKVEIVDETERDDNGNPTKIAHSLKVDGEEQEGIQIEVENHAGTVLPSTGGIGTTLFYVFGTLLVLAAGVVLVTKRRVRE